MINAGKHQTAVRYVDSGKLGRRDCMCYALKLNLFTRCFAPSVIKTGLNPEALFLLSSHFPFTFCLAKRSWWSPHSLPSLHPEPLWLCQNDMPFTLNLAVFHYSFFLTFLSAVTLVPSLVHLWITFMQIID